MWKLAINFVVTYLVCDNICKFFKQSVSDIENQQANWRTFYNVKFNTDCGRLVISFSPASRYFTVSCVPNRALLSVVFICIRKLYSAHRCMTNFPYITRMKRDYFGSGRTETGKRHMVLITICLLFYSQTSRFNEIYLFLISHLLFLFVNLFTLL